MARKTEQWIVRSYLAQNENDTENRKLLVERRYELHRQPDGGWETILMETQRCIEQGEQKDILRECCGGSGKVLSDTVANKPDSGLAAGSYRITDLLHS